VIIAVIITKPFLSNFGQGFPVHPELHGLRHAGHLRDLPAGPVLGAHHGDGGDGLDARHGLDVRLFLQVPAGLSFMNRVGWCFVAGIVIAVAISLMSPKERRRDARRYHECRLQDRHVLQCRGRS
jgi:hypothetical protein